MPYLRSHLSTYRKQGVGLAFLLAWNYCMLYGCAVSSHVMFRGNLECIWLVAGLCECIAAAVALGLQRRFDFARSRAVGVVGAACAVAGTASLWLIYFDTELYWPFFILTGTLCGIGLALMACVWGQLLSQRNEAEIEFTVIASFIIAFALYCILLPIQLWGILDLVVVGAFPVASMLLAFRTAEPEARPKPVGSGAPLAKDLQRIGSLLALLAVLWFMLAYLRTIAEPAVVESRFDHYFIPFFTAFVFTACFFVLIVKVSRFLNFTLAVRWTLPFLLLAFALLAANYDDRATRTVAYAINFIAVFGLQMSCWVSAPKYVRRMGVSPVVLFLGMAGSEGLGIFAGTSMGLWQSSLHEGTELMLWSAAFLVAVFFVAMMAGFNPDWFFNRSRAYPAESRGVRKPDEAAEDRGEVDVESIFVGESLDLQRRYGLTERETEVASLLLAGRSRPYIRDELVVSLNTIHTHARSIFAKCGVHSQQELIDLGRNRKSADVAERG